MYKQLKTREWRLRWFCVRPDLPKYYQLRDELHKRYEIRDLGSLRWFTSVRILRDRSQKNGGCVKMRTLIRLAAFHLEDLKNATTPMRVENELRRKTTTQEIYAYQRKVGLLICGDNYRAGVVFTAAKLPGFLQNLSPYHHGAVNRALSYLNGTQTLAIGFKISLNSERVFLGVTDAHSQMIL